MSRKIFFTKKETVGKIGKKIETKKPFILVPKDTTGTVIGINRIFEGYGLAIEWDLGNRKLVDWVSKDDYERFLAEID